MLKNKKSTIIPLISALRPGQWIKNFLLFAAIIFNGKLFNSFLFRRTLEGFIIFCALSSASYLLNDIIDAPLDKNHPKKKNRPIASGALSRSRAFEIMIFLAIIGLAGAFTIRLSFFSIAAAFFLLHVGYSFYFKRFAILDILSIALSFVLRAFAGEVLTGFHLPIWLMFTVLFLSLFIASSKRLSEFALIERAKTRPSLRDYKSKLLDFYVSTFATAAIVTYAMFAFIEGIPQFSGRVISPMLAAWIPELLSRKWLIITVPFVIIGIMRYAQLVYARSLGEAPEELVTSDIPLVATILGWGLSVVFIIYII